jgi:trigger factor
VLFAAVYSRSAVEREGLEGLRRNDSSLSKTRRGGTARSFVPRPERESAEPRKARSGACTGRAHIKNCDFFGEMTILDRGVLDFLFNFHYFLSMSITKEITPLENSAVRLDVTISKEELGVEYEKAVDDIAKTVQIPGFRKGKAPRNVIERKLGAALLEDVANGIIGDTVKTIIEDEAFPKKYQPLAYSSPVIDGAFPTLDLESDLKFAVKWDVMPQFEVNAWKGLSAEVADVKVEDADVLRELDRVRDWNATVMDRPPEESARSGDVVTVNYAEKETVESEKEIPGSRRDGFVFTLGSYANVYRFDDELIGMKVGETKVFAKEFPEEYDDVDLAGTIRVVEVTVTAVKEKQLPELNDDLAQDINEKFKTLDDLKKDIRDRMNERLEERLREVKLDAVLKKMVEQNPIDLPDAMVEYELESRLVAFMHRMGMPDEKIRQAMYDRQRSGRDVAESQRAEVAQTLRVSLIQSKLIEDLKIEVSDDDRQAEIEKIARDEGTDVASVSGYYTQDKGRAQLDGYLQTRKLRDLLLQENTVTAGEKQSYEDFIGDARE